MMLLVRALRAPEIAGDLSLAEWDLLIRQARRANLLARLAVRMEAQERAAAVPAGPAAHLRSARILADKHARDVRWEVRCLKNCLGQAGVHFTLLKGAAYVMAGLPAAAGRLFSDIDIMVPERDLRTAENALKEDGWIFAKSDAYDQRYYRTWMHQLPPMQHFRRQSVVDVHHTIVPRTARNPVDAAPLAERAQPLPGWDGVLVLAPVDMVLHSATHLFNEGEVPNGLRDLADLDALLRHFAVNPDFWPALTARAEALRLTRPLHYALHHLAETFATPMPESAREPGRPGPALGLAMQAMLTRVLQPDHASCRKPFTGLARWALYVRGHALRMPPHLLLPHLVRKALADRDS